MPRGSNSRWWRCPFFGIIFAIIEVALTFWATQVLENAVAAMHSRQILYGAIPRMPADRARMLFRDEICSRVTGVVQLQ